MAGRPNGKAEEDEGGSCDDLPWKCCRCPNLLGYVDRATRTTLRLKYKDAFVWIRKAESVATPCRKCGAYNELLDESVDGPVVQDRPVDELLARAGDTPA